jgi:hypothetical protein
LQPPDGADGFVDDSFVVSLFLPTDSPRSFFQRLFPGGTIDRGQLDSEIKKKGLLGSV